MTLINELTHCTTHAYNIVIRVWREHYNSLCIIAKLILVVGSCTLIRSSTSRPPCDCVSQPIKNNQVYCFSFPFTYLYYKIQQRIILIVFIGESQDTLLNSTTEPYYGLLDHGWGIEKLLILNLLQPWGSYRYEL